MRYGFVLPIGYYRTYGEGMEGWVEVSTAYLGFDTKTI